MQLLLRVRPAGPRAALPRDLRIEIDPETTVSALAGELAAALGLPVGGTPPGLFHDPTGVRLDPHVAIGASGLVSGACVTLGDAPPARGGDEGQGDGDEGYRDGTAGQGQITLDVLAGPEAGRSLVLTPGRHVVGRGTAATIRIADPTLSPRQLVLIVDGAGACTLAPEPGTTNEVRVDGRPATQPLTLGAESTVQAGATVLAVRSLAGQVAIGVDRLGTIPFHRTPYRPSTIQERAFEPLGDLPTRPDPRRFSLLGGLAPLAGGLALYAFSRQPQFLALTALTPVTMAATWIEERRSGGRRFDREAARFRRELAARRQAVDQALQAERVERMRAAPDAIELARRARRRSVDLWPRGRSNGDFLDLRAGLGRVASNVRAPVGAQGDTELRREAAAALTGHDTLDAVPIVVSMSRLGTLALQGDEAITQRVAASLLLQAAALHSPEDLIMAAALAPGGPLPGQLKWLPHTRSLSSPLDRPHVVTSAAEAQALCTQLIAVAQRRATERQHGSDTRWPWLLVVLDEELELNAGVVGRLLDQAPDAGISVLWLTTSTARIPHQAAAVLHCRPSEQGPSELWFRDPAVPATPLEIEPLAPEITEMALRSLAPMRDASSASVTSAMPRVVPLFDPLGFHGGFDEDGGEPQAAERRARAVVERWLAAEGLGLDAAFGLTAEGLMTIDLVADGPHCLIGGTSGSGKSELLVALVAGLIARHPPTRLNLLFVDYKGGAACSAFRTAPHTVGYVTNLHGDLANRALVSLRAELNRRMRILEGRAKDLAEMVERHPADAPHSLVIVVDEFATLVKEVPDFVPGIVDIAQRGRSLGIHLILATQRPSGAVDENILANTNARICLRMIDGSESSAIIGTPEAASIPVPLRGRALARLGPGELTAFQTAYAGARLQPTASAGRIAIDDFAPAPGGAGPFSPLVRPGTPQNRTGAPSQLDALLAAVDGAAAVLQLPAPPAPWIDELPPLVPLDVVLRGFRSPAGRWSLPVGELDDPERQRRDTLAVDLEEGGGLLVYGAAGSGKTTALRTIAGAALAGSPPEGLVIVAVDFASRALRALESLKACAGVATGDDLEAVTRLLALLELEVAHRRGLLAGAESLSAHLRSGGAPLPRILLLVDGYPALRDTLSGEGASPAMHTWLDRFHRLVTEGRQVGLHTVVGSDRPAAVAPVLASGIARRLILRQVDERGLIELGVAAARARGTELGPGRGFLDGDALVQVACLATVRSAADGAAQTSRLIELAGRSQAAAALAPQLCTSALGETEPLPAPPGLGPLEVVLGVEDVTRAPVVVDLGEGPLAICGPPRSGRSTALAALVDGLALRGPDTFVVGPPASSLARRALPCPAAFGDVAPLAAELLEATTTYPELPRVLLIDDADRLLEDPAAAAVLDPLARCDAVRVVAALETGSLVAGYFQSALMGQLKRVRRRLLLQPLDGGEIQSVLGVRLALRPGLATPPGRGVLLAGRSPVVLQVGSPP